MDITREYNHRKHGEIGKVTFTAPDGKYTVNGKELPASGVAHLLTFALQSFQDAYAGADNHDEAVALHDKKVQAVINGTVGTRTGGVTDIHRVMRSLARKVLRRDMTTDEFKAFNATEKTEQNAKLDAMVEANADAYESAADKHIKAEAKRQAELTELTGTLGAVV